MLHLDPALPVTMKRGMHRGFTLLLRERSWGTSLGALVGVMILVQMLLTSLFAVAAVQHLLASRADVRLEIRTDATRAATQQFLSALKALPYVSDATYITREQAYARAAKEEPDLVSFLEKFGMGNPFPDTVGVTLSSLDDYPLLSTFITGAEWQKVADPTFLSTISRTAAGAFPILSIEASNFSTPSKSATPPPWFMFSPFGVSFMQTGFIFKLLKRSSCMEYSCSS